MVSRAGMLLCALGLIGVLFVPMWRIELEAPQYPEGLMLQIFPDELGGDVEIINGLNHYIGMKTLHTDDFIEFKLLPYLIGFFALLATLVAAIGRRGGLILFLLAFITFGIVAIVDFWRWEYDYGHDLNPNAAIQVQGMAYQPPLIGFKQLLNFGAYSIPDTGGWIFLSVGFISIILVVIEMKQKIRNSMRPAIAVIAVCTTLFVQSCSIGPEPLSIGKDQCNFCKMKIAETHFGCEVVTAKGKVYKFDDISCAAQFINKENIQTDNLFGVFVSNYASENELLNTKDCIFFKSEEFRSPMNGNIAAFSNRDEMSKVIGEMHGEEITWQYILNQYK